MNTLLSNLWRIFLSAAFCISFIFAPNLLSQDLEIGETLFKTNCTSCHYLGPEEKKLIDSVLNTF